MPTRKLASAVSALTVFAVCSAWAEAPLAPTLDVAGRSLVLASCGVREVLWVPVYAAGLYLPPGAAADAATDASRPSALRVRVLSGVHFPWGIPQKWRRALERSLGGAEMERVEDAYRSLRDGDLLTLRYAPGHGVALLVNGVPVANGGHGLIIDLLDAWAEDQAPAQKVRELVLDHPCER